MPLSAAIRARFWRLASSSIHTIRPGEHTCAILAHSRSQWWTPESVKRVGPRGLSPARRFPIPSPCHARSTRAA